MRNFVKIPEKRKSSLKRVLKKFEDLTNTKITINDEISVEGESFEVFQTKRALKAFGRGFNFDDCAKLFEDEYDLEIIDLTEFTRTRERLKVLKGRIIGTKGKTKKYIEEHTNAKISVFGKTVGIIGKWEELNLARRALMMIIEGCTHKTLYKWLEQNSLRGKRW